jgi:hypothetical protein
MRSVVVAVLAAAALAVPASAVAAPEIAAPLPTVHAAQATPTGTTTGTTTTPTPTPTPAPLNVASDKVALNAYATYLASVVKGAPLGQDNDTTYLTTISSQCKGALAQLAQPNNEVDTSIQATLTALGEEMGDDLSINFDQAAFSPFMRLTTSLTRLRWTRLSTGTAIVRRFLTTETIVLESTTSSLCQNALLAASEPDTVPLATKSFIKSYAKASTAANNALANLLKLMQAYQIPAEKAVVTRIANLASQITKLTKAELVTDGSTLTSTLESS